MNERPVQLIKPLAAIDSLQANYETRVFDDSLGIHQWRGATSAFKALAWLIYYEIKGCAPNQFYSRNGTFHQDETKSKK